MPFSLLALYRWVKLVISPRLAAVRVRSICGELRWCRTYVSNSHYWKYDGGLDIFDDGEDNDYGGGGGDDHIMMIVTLGMCV